MSSVPQVETKVCARCKQELPVSEFGRHNTRGYQAYCKACSSADGAERRKKAQQQAESEYQTGNVDPLLIRQAQEAVQPIEGKPVIDSRDLAKVFDKEHKHVLDTIRVEAEEEGGDTEPIFRLSSYKDASGKSNTCYHLTYRGFLQVAMGFTGAKARKLRRVVLDRMEELEQQLRQQHARPVNRSVDEQVEDNPERMQRIVDNCLQKREIQEQREFTAEQRQWYLQKAKQLELEDAQLARQLEQLHQERKAIDNGNVPGWFYIVWLNEEEGKLKFGQTDTSVEERFSKGYAGREPLIKVRCLNSKACQDALNAKYSTYKVSKKVDWKRNVPRPVLEHLLTWLQQFDETNPMTTEAVKQFAPKGQMF